MGKDKQTVGAVYKLVNGDEFIPAAYIDKLKKLIAEYKVAIASDFNITSSTHLNHIDMVEVADIVEKGHALSSYVNELQIDKDGFGYRLYLLLKIKPAYGLPSFIELVKELGKGEKCHEGIADKMTEFINTVFKRHDNA